MANNVALFSDALDYYWFRMKRALRYIDTHYSEDEFLALHQTTKNEAIKQV